MDNVGPTQTTDLYYSNSTGDFFWCDLSPVVTDSLLLASDGARRLMAELALLLALGDRLSWLSSEPDPYHDGRLRCRTHRRLPLGSQVFAHRGGGRPNAVRGRTGPWPRGQRG